MKIRISERGQSLVELSISMLVLLYLLSGAVEFGLAFFQFVQLRDAAQEGALFASMNPSVGAAPIETRVRSSSGAVGDPGSPIYLWQNDPSQPRYVAVTITAKDVESGNDIPDVARACEGDAITVRVSFDHQIFMPFIPAIIGRSTLPLHASVTDTVLSPRPGSAGTNCY
jgi:Flp pilus assembly protein TadG